MANLQRNDQPWTDEIVSEVREAREQIFAACGYDLKTLAERLRVAQEASGRRVVTYPKRLPQGPVSA